MSYTLSFFIAEDDLSNKMASILNDLIGRIKGSAKIRYSDSIGMSMTNVRIGLKSALGREDILELKIYSILGAYVDSFKLRYGLPGFPAVKLGETVRWGAEAITAASKLYSLLAEGGTLTAEQIFYNIASYMQGSGGVGEALEGRIVTEAGAAMDISRIQEVVESLMKNNPDITGCAILDEKGSIIACSIPSEMGEENVSVAFATLRSAAEKTAQQMELERINQFVIFAEMGGALFQRHDNLFLLVFMRTDAKLGAVIMELGYAAERLKQITATKP